MYPWYKKINPIWWWGNEDDGNCGTTKFQNLACNNTCDIKCKVKWALRNPLHNFCFYVIGVKDRDYRTYDSWYGHTIFAPEKGKYNIGWTTLKYIKLPILSYKGFDYEWYIGWRPQGAFGLAYRVTDAIGM